MEAMHSNPFNVGDSRSRRDKLDNKLRLALGRGLAALLSLDNVEDLGADRLMRAIA